MVVIVGIWEAAKLRMLRVPVERESVALVFTVKGNDNVVIFEVTGTAEMKIEKKKKKCDVSVVFAMTNV